MSGQPSSGIPPLSLPIGDLPMDESTPSTGAPVALGPQAARPSARSLARRERADGANRSVVRSRVRDLNSRTRGVTERIERVQRIYTEEPDREREPAVLHYMKAEETFARENAAMRHQMAVMEQEAREWYAAHQEAAEVQRSRIEARWNLEVSNWHHTAREWEEMAQDR